MFFVIYNFSSDIFYNPANLKYLYLILNVFLAHQLIFSRFRHLLPFLPPTLTAMIHQRTKTQCLGLSRKQSLQHYCRK